MKNKAFKTKLLTVLLTLCMLLSLVPISAFAVDSTVSNETELTAALENADCAEIKLGGSIETTWELDVGRTVTLDLNGYTLSCSGTDEDIIRVRSSGSLTIKDSSTGGKIDGQNKNCGIEVKGGTLTLESGRIVNCTDADGDGGAVDVSNTGVTETQVKYGKFIMNGGAIMDCKAGDDGGAVDIGSGCTFIMNGGTISSCRADDDGGAVLIKQSGSFELNGGVIQNCSAGANGGAVNIYQDGRFTMTGGTIKSCKVDLGGLGMAVYGSNDKAVVTMTGGTFEDCGAYPYSFDEFTVTFDSDGGSAVTAQKVLNSPAIKPADPTKNGYLFAGWYLEDMQYAFDTTVTTDITLKAHWTPTSASTAISAATIQNVKFNYQLGDAPQATAWVAIDDMDKYEIAYECWQQFENNEPVSAWYSDNDSHGSLPTITEFESGKKYVYFIMLKPKDGYSFSNEVAMTVNGESVKSSLSGDFLYVPAVKTITMPTIKVIDVVEINDATVSFKDGDKPVFTGDVPDDVYYVLRAAWWELNSTTGLISTEPEFGSGIYENKITTFEAGKTYHYGVYVVAYGDVGNIRYIFGPDTKLKINGEFVNYTRYEGDESDGSDGTMWVLTDLTMTPEAGGTTPAEKYAVTYTDGVDNKEIFKDQVYTVEFGKATPAFNGTPSRDGYKFTGWTPTVADTVTRNATYTAQWEKLTPAETFTVTYTDGVDNEEIFKDQVYTVKFGKATPAFNGTPARDGYKFTGWTPAVADIVTRNATYTAQWEKLTPAETFTVTYTDGVDNEEIFKDQVYTVEFGKATPAFNGTPTRKGYTFAGWKPAVAATVTSNATYEATWKSDSAMTTPSDNKPSTGETTSPNTGNGTTSPKTGDTTSPKTGDTSNMLLWFALLFVSGGVAIATTVVSRKKKYNR